MDNLNTDTIQTISTSSTQAVVAHILASKDSRPNAFGAQIPVNTLLNVDKWHSYLIAYNDNDVVQFLKFGWPINYTSNEMPHASNKNHNSAITYAKHVDHFLKTELGYGAIAGPFTVNPLSRELITSPLQTVPKRGSDKRRVVMDLSFPPENSVNDGIPSDSYLDNAFKLYLPGIDRLREFIINKGQGCFVFKKDLQRAYRQLPVDPKDYKYLGFQWDGQLYFDLRCPFGLRSSALICQRTTKAVIYIFTQEGYTADVYLDDFYGAETTQKAVQAFERLTQLFIELGLQSSPEKDSYPSTNMVCLGIMVNTDDMTFSVPQERVLELRNELSKWLEKSFYSRRQLQSLLGKLVFVSACVRPGRVFMSRLLNCLRDMKTTSGKVNDDMITDIKWWLSFLEHFNGVTLIQHQLHQFSDIRFTTDASLHSGGATCFVECITFNFPPEIASQSLHINALELYALVIALRHWAPRLAGSFFLLSCDNEATVQVVNSGRCRDKFMQRCLRQLWFTCARYDLQVHVQHIPGSHNSLADCLSRWDHQHYRRRFKDLEHELGLSFTMLSLDRDLFMFQIS